MAESPAASFKDMKFYPWIIRQLAALGIKTPTPVQAHCIPQIMAGKDCIGAAKTGGGKTLAFALPIIQKLCQEPFSIFALILTPTRELAVQIGDQLAVMGKTMNLQHCVVVGGMDMLKQSQDLANHPHIVVATPGRLADHLQGCNTFSFANIEFLVLDEADRLMGGFFDEDIKTIFKVLPKKRQNLFFSATITDTLQKLKGYLKNEVFVYESPDDVATVEQLEQRYVLCPGYAKDVYLVEVIRTFRAANSGNIIIFTDTCGQCQVLSMTFNDVGFENVALHGMLKQKDRIAALSRFKSSTSKILIATDVASRGLDIPEVQLVINHSVPSVPKDYVHRVGRTARAGRSGKAITLVTPEDVKLLQAIEAHVNVKMTEFKVKDKEVANIFTEVSVTKKENYLKLDEDKFYETKMVNMRKKWTLEGLDPDEEEEKYMERIKKGKRKERGNEGNCKKRKVEVAEVE